MISSRHSGAAYVATLATNDPAGGRLRVRIAPGGAGVIALAARATGSGVTHVGIAFAARRGERYLGFGERSNAVDQRGREVENYVAEGPFEEDERAAVPAFVPPGRSSARLEDGGVVRSFERRGEWALTIRSQRRRRWTIEASLATLRQPLRVCGVSAPRGRLGGWSFDERSRVLRATLWARRGTLVARGCRG